MNNKTSNISDEVIKLIPWFSIGKLSTNDQIFFDNSLVSNPSLQQQLDLEQQLIRSITKDSSLLDKSAIASQDERLKTVFNMIDAKESQYHSEKTSQPKVLSALKNKLKKAFGFLITGPDLITQYSRVACASALIVSVAILTTVSVPQLTPTSEFIPASADVQASGDQTSASELTLLVGFNGTPEELASNKVLKGKLVTIENAPDKDGFFQIKFKQAMNADEIKQTIDALLEQEETVWFAGEAF